jgi:hypothetical protein
LHFLILRIYYTYRNYYYYYINIMLILWHDAWKRKEFIATQRLGKQVSAEINMHAIEKLHFLSNGSLNMPC